MTKRPAFFVLSNILNADSPQLVIATGLFRNVFAKLY